MNKPLITVNNVNKITQGRVILRDISFDITQGTLVSLIGPNGAGKSTLINILLDFDSAYDGSVMFAPNQQVAYIPQIDHQDVIPTPLSVREYIQVGTASLYGTPHARSLGLEKALTHVGIDHQKLDQSLWSLSGGERQRVAIARALLSEPTILILDEPLSAVDYASRKGLYSLIRHLQQDHGITVILVSHDIDSVLPISDRVLCLNQTLHEDCHPCEYHDGVFATPKHIHHHC